MFKGISYFQILITINIIATLYSCTPSQGTVTEDEIQKQRTAADIIEVETFQLQSGPFNSEIITNGKLLAVAKADLHFKTNESIVTINFKNGDKVNKGALIAQQDNSILQNNYYQAKTAFEKATLDRQTKLIEYGINPKNLSTADTNILKIIDIQSGYNAASLQLDNAKNQLKYSYLYAPFTGVIANIRLKQHQNANTAEPFCSVIDNSRFEVQFQVMESELKQINNGNNVSVFLFGDTLAYNGIISEMNPVIDQNGTIQVKALILSAGHQFFDGMNVQVVVKRAMANCLVVPKQAVILRSGKPVVFTLEKNLAKWKYVVLGGENSGSYLITEGLNAGDVVIISNNLNLAHDAQVKKSGK